MVSREVYGRHVCIVRMLWVSSSFPRSEGETRLLVDFAARPRHVVAPVLPARLLLVDVAALPEATALDAQNPNPFVTTFRGCEFVVELKVWTGSRHQLGWATTLLSRQRSRRRTPFLGPHRHQLENFATIAAQRIGIPNSSNSGTLRPKQTSC